MQISHLKWLLSETYTKPNTANRWPNVIRYKKLLNIECDQFKSLPTYWWTSLSTYLFINVTCKCPKERPLNISVLRSPQFQRRAECNVWQLLFNIFFFCWGPDDSMNFSPELWSSGKNYWVGSLFFFWYCVYFPSNSMQILIILSKTPTLNVLNWNHTPSKVLYLKWTTWVWWVQRDSKNNVLFFG